MGHEIVEKILELIPPLIDSLAWPFTVILIILLLRKQLQELIHRAEEFETKWFKVRLSEAIDDIKAEFSKVDATVPPDTSREESASPKLEDLYAPSTEVMSAWADVEALCQRLLAKNDVHVPRTYRALGSRLKRNQLIDSEHAAILDKLRQVRNIAEHGDPDNVGAREAQEYITLAERMMAYLSQQVGDE